MRSMCLTDVFLAKRRMQYHCLCSSNAALTAESKMGKAMNMPQSFLSFFNTGLAATDTIRYYCSI